MPTVPAVLSAAKLKSFALQWIALTANRIAANATMRAAKNVGLSRSIVRVTANARASGAALIPYAMNARMEKRRPAAMQAKAVVKMAIVRDRRTEPHLHPKEVRVALFP